MATARDPTTHEPLSTPSASSPLSSRAGGNGDAIVQGALVELFAAHGISAAPLPKRSGAYDLAVPELSVVTEFKRRTNSELKGGRLTLSVAQGLAESLKPGETRSIQLDWVRELTNQLAGRIKNRLLNFGVRLELGVPLLAQQKMLEHELQAGSAGRLYSARSVRGPILVTARGLPDASELSYVGRAGPVEGSMLLF